MPHDLQKQIENHLSSFPERHEEMIEMRKEWKQLQGKVVWVLIGFVGSILSIGIWVGTVQTNVDSGLEYDRDHAQQYTEIEKRVTSLEITNSEIRARLSSIDLALQEIKIAIKSIR